MSYNPNNPNGSTTAANSAPVTVATDNNLAKETGGNLATLVTNTTSIATSALQTTGNTSLSTIATNTGNGATSANQTNGTQQTKLTDGTNIATVKAASTAAGATDKAVVVAVSPNNTVGVTGTFWQATQPVSLATNTPVIATGTNTIGSVKLTDAGANGLDITGEGFTSADGKTGLKMMARTAGSGVSAVAKPILVDASGNLLTSNNTALPAGSALIGKVGIDQTTPGTTNQVSAVQNGTWTVQPGNTANTTPWLVQDSPATSGGLLIVTGSVGATATAIKASAGQLYGYHLFNTTAAVAYVQIFNVAAGSVTLGTTAPTFSIGIPASGGVTVNWDKGIAFATAISFACTTTRTGSTGATCDVNFFYK